MVTLQRKYRQLLQYMMLIDGNKKTNLIQIMPASCFLNGDDLLYQFIQQDMITFTINTMLDKCIFLPNDDTPQSISNLNNVGACSDTFIDPSR